MYSDILLWKIKMQLRAKEMLRVRFGFPSNHSCQPIDHKQREDFKTKVGLQGTDPRKM